MDFNLVFEGSRSDEVEMRGQRDHRSITCLDAAHSSLLLDIPDLEHSMGGACDDVAVREPLHTSDNLILTIHATQLLHLLVAIE